MAKRKRFNPYQEIIIRRLANSRMPLSTSEVAEKSNMHWKTAERHLDSLAKKKWVIKLMEGDRPFWELNWEKIQVVKAKLNSGADYRVR